MMKTILIQLDSDDQPSVFDRVVAVDAGVDHLFSYGGVTPQNVQGLVHGAMFTRGPDVLRHTAIFIGGSSVEKGEAILRQVQETFFGPLRVSVMMDANGANTTAAAAVLAAARHVVLKDGIALVLGGTGPVGQRVARLLARQGAAVRLASRQRVRAASAAEAINDAVQRQAVTPVRVGDNTDLPAALDGVRVVIAAGAAGVQLLPAVTMRNATELTVAIDLNAVPPAGIEGVGVADKAKEHGGITCYGAVGVGGRKMKIHRAAIEELFAANDRILDAEAIYAIGEALG